VIAAGAAAVTGIVLASLDLGDIAQARNGLEIRLYRRAHRAVRYVMIPSDADGNLCPVRALLAWRGCLLTAGHRAGPLFIKMNQNGNVPHANVRITGAAVVGVVVNAVGWSTGHPVLTQSTLLLDFLDKLWKL